MISVMYKISAREMRGSGRTVAKFERNLYFYAYNKFKCRRGG